MNKDRLLERFLRYVQTDSESGAERQMCELIESELKSMGLEVWRNEIGGRFGSDGFNVCARMPGEGEAVLLSAHLDTVTPGKGVKPVVKDGIIRSSGDTVLGGDDKSGVAAIMEAIESVKESGAAHRTTEVLFSISEETGLYGSRNADYSKFTAKTAAVFDSGEHESVINRAPAHIVMKVEITGKAAHAGIAPEEGIHALKAAADAVSKIPCGNVDDITVMNVANFLAPGKSNIVCDKASFEVEIRCFDEQGLKKRIEETENAIEAAAERYGAAYKTEIETHSGVLYVPEDSEILKTVLEGYEKLGIHASAERTYGGSDASSITAAGIPALNLGTGVSDVHTVGEYLKKEDMEIACEIAERLIKIHK